VPSTNLRAAGSPLFKNKQQVTGLFANRSDTIKPVRYHQTGQIPSNWSYTIKLVIYHRTGQIPSNRSYTIEPVIYHRTGHIPSNRSYTIEPVIYHRTGQIPSNRSYTIKPVDGPICVFSGAPEYTSSVIWVLALILWVGQNHTYPEYIWSFWQGKKQIYGVYTRFWPTLLILARADADHVFD